MDDLYVFAADTAKEILSDKLHKMQPWKVLIVDDEPDVHKITKLVLESVTFENKNVELLHAYSAAEAKEVLQRQPKNAPIAVAFIDVVMETDTAGLDLVKYIREEMDNHITRIILRTGQPGQAPEESVIKDYDINDYKSKTELTSSKLKTTLYASLRSYRDIMTIDNHRVGLQKVLKAIGNISSETNLRSLTSLILSQIATVLDLEEDAMYCTVLTTPTQQDHNGQQFKVLAKAGDLFSELKEDEICTLPPEVHTLFQQSYQQKSSIQKGIEFVAYISNDLGEENLLYVRKSQPLSELNLHLLDIFIDNFVKAHTALTLKDEVEQSQSELVHILGEAVEVRSKETGSHVKRVGQISYILAKAYGLNKFDCALIKLASPLHDVGKVSIPDHVLNKPGRHDEDERQIMQSHAEVGYNILSKSKSASLKTAALISLEHHEHWDGGGYPAGKIGDETHVMSRITGLADVFDALGSKRCYKEPWPIERIVDLISEQKGKQFEPRLVDLLLEYLDEIKMVRTLYPD
ncbi:DUF3369 domain-containing protein [Thiomicrorhabdus arctica]|uniref:DUF3369 domain-containing protein n=1 Tax=Thiomicrorhabdus arctica TaxID=131540 RepID=UPI0003701DE3|nr:DUF3369 domain-containing protein [Thiomicrorhabdus arctica]